MRTKFVIVVVVPLICLLAILYLFLDGWIESGLETAGEAVVGAKVEIDDLRLTLMPIGIRFSRLQVADPREPFTNTIETGTVAFALDFGQLLRGKYIIETMEVNDLILGSERETDGSLPDARPEGPSPATHEVSGGPPLAAGMDSLRTEKEKETPLFDPASLRSLVNIDSLLDRGNLATFQHLDSLERQVQQLEKEWETTRSEFDKSREQIADIERRVKAININELKTLPAIAEAIKNVDAIRKEAGEVTSAFQARKNAVTTSLDALNRSVRSVDDFVRSDFDNLLRSARLPDVSMRGLAEMILGPGIFAKAEEYLSYVDFARENIRNSSPTPEKTSPPRLQGQTIHFPTDREYPKFCIRRILVSGGTAPERNPNYFYARGEILNISSNQTITGQPLTIDLAAEQGRGTKATVKASIDRRQEPLDTYMVQMSGVPIAAMSLGRSDFVPSRITGASGEFTVEATVPGAGFNANARILMSNLTLEFQREPRTTVERLVRDVLASISTLSARLRIWREQQGLQIAFETDLDDRLAAQARTVIGQEVTRLRNELKAKLEKKIAEKRALVERQVNATRGEITERLRNYESQAREKLGMVEEKKKELDQKVEDEKKKQEDALKKKGGDLLKGILRK